MTSKALMILEADLRLRNTEHMRAVLWRKIAKLRRTEKLTSGESAQIRRQFWTDRLRDKKIARGEL